MIRGKLILSPTFNTRIETEGEVPSRRVDIEPNGTLRAIDIDSTSFASYIQDGNEIYLRKVYHEIVAPCTLLSVDVEGHVKIGNDILCRYKYQNGRLVHCTPRLNHLSRQVTPCTWEGCQCEHHGFMTLVANQGLMHCWAACKCKSRRHVTIEEIRACHEALSDDDDF